MTEPNPGEEFAQWLGERTGPSRLGHSTPADAPTAEDPGEAFSAYLRASLAGYQPETTTTESETP